MESATAQLATYQRDIVYKHREDIGRLPVKYHGIVYSTIQYKFLRSEMIKMLGELVDSVIPQLSLPLQRLTDALIDFSDAYGNNLGIYYSLYGMCGELMHNIIAQRDVKSAEALMDAVTHSVAQGKNLGKYSEELKESLKQLERTIISIASGHNTKKLEEDVENAYTNTRKYMMEAEHIKRDLAIERSTLQLLADTSITDKEVHKNLESRIQNELSSVQNQQQVLDRAVSDDGKVTTKTHHGSYGWRWWYYGGDYAYTTSSTKDTTVEQNTAKKHISTIEDRVATLRARLEQGAITRNTREQMTKSNIDRYTQELQILESRRDKELAVAKKNEELLTQARLDAAGCSSETSKKLTEIFKLTLPLFVQLVDNTAKVSTIFSTVQSVIQSTSKMSVTSALSIFDEITKMAIAGDYVVNNGFTISTEFQSQKLQTYTTVYNSAAQAMMALPPADKTFENITMMQDLSPASRTEVEKVAVVLAVTPQELF